MSEKVLVDRELLAKASMLPSMKSLEENRRDIVERGRAQAEIRELLAAPAAPVARAEQEPVARIRKNGFRFIAEIEPQDGSEVPLYAAPPAQPDASGLVEALEQVIKAAPSGGPLWHGSEQIVEARAALAAHRKQEASHDNQ